MRQTCSWAILAAGLFGLALCGCSKGGGGGKITGSVTADGQPVPGAKVVFEGVNKALGMAVARTGEDGKFAFLPRPKSSEPPLKPGKYNVFISWLVDKSGKVPNDEDY